MSGFVKLCVDVLEEFWGGFKMLAPMLAADAWVKIMKISDQVDVLEDRTWFLRVSIDELDVSAARFKSKR